VNRSPAFEVTDPGVIARLVRDLAFAQVVTTGDGGFAASSVPLLLDVPDHGRPWRLRGHLARTNPQAGIGAAGVPALALFVGPHAYVSPSAYPSKVETGRVVPTWNFVEVHAHGTFRLTDDAATTLAVVTDLTDVHEATRPEPWRVADAPDDYVKRLARGIVAFEIIVDRVEAKAKLSQNKSVADRRGVVEDLSARPGGGEAVAGLMRSGEFSPADPPADPPAEPPADPPAEPPADPPPAG
jgi:transcriptional regulator